MTLSLGKIHVDLPPTQEKESSIVASGSTANMSLGEHVVPTLSTLETSPSQPRLKQF